MATALDIISAAYSRLGLYAAGETIPSADAQLGLTRLNDMLDSWSNESLACYCYLVQSFLMQVGISQYSVGPGGVINGPRPLRLVDVPGSSWIMDPNNNRYPMDVVPQDTWYLIGAPTVNSNLPDTMYYDPQFPLGLINIFPVPNLSWTCYFTSYAQLTEFATLTQIISLPSGYKTAFQDNLAVYMQPEFADSQISPVVVASAAKAKGNIKRTNLRPMISRYDSELISRANVTPNIYTGGLN